MRKNLFSWQKSLCRKRGKNPYLVGALMLLLGTASAQSLNQSAHLSEPYRMPQINFAGTQFISDGIMEPEEGTCDLVGELENPSSGSRLEQSRCKRKSCSGLGSRKRSALPRLRTFYGE